jgi:hypothetical protein
MKKINIIAKIKNKLAYLISVEIAIRMEKIIKN